MKKLFLYTLVLGLLLFVFQSCKDKTTLDDFQVEYGYEYYPLEIGKYREYQVDSTTYDFGPNGNTVISSSITFLREEVTDTITDNLGRLGYKIERSEKRNLSDPWQIKDVWMTITTDAQAESLEENLRFIKMIFPLKEGLVWDGNRFIDATTTVAIAGESLEMFKSWEYEIKSIDEPGVVNNELFDELVEIQQADNENLIERRFSKEQYAKGVGLVSREMEILDTQCITPCEGMQWEEKAEKGFTLRQLILAWN